MGGSVLHIHIAFYCAGKRDFRLCVMDRHLGVCSHPNIVIISETTTMASVEGSLKDRS